jgi:hypothetical protein
MTVMGSKKSASAPLRSGAPEPVNTSIDIIDTDANRDGANAEMYAQGRVMVFLAPGDSIRGSIEPEARSA